MRAPKPSIDTEVQPGQQMIDGNEVAPGGITIVRGDDAIRFTVLGRPQPAGSKRAFTHPTTKKVMVVDAAKGSRPWKQQVAGAAFNLVPSGRLLTGPLKLEVTFYLARPAGHYGSGRNAGTLKESAPAYPTVRPDATKLLRAVEDALTGIVWRDDAQIVEQVARKRYGTPERCEVAISEIASG